jgi:hypothetical protein
MYSHREDSHYPDGYELFPNIFNNERAHFVKVFHHEVLPDTV